VKEEGSMKSNMNGKGWESWSTGAKAAAIVAGVVGGAGLAVLFGFVLMWLWNGLMPAIFGLPGIGYWQGWGLLILSSILFKGTGSHGGGNREERKRKRVIRERMGECRSPEEGTADDGGADGDADRA
jgi:hypothetical protein